MTSPSLSKGARDLSLMSLLWLPRTVFWSAVMTQVLAERVEFFAGDQKGRYLAIIGVTGAVAATAVQLLIGPISDNCTHPRGRRYPFILWGILLSIPPILFFAWSVTFWQLMLAFLLIQIVLNIGEGPFQALIPDIVPPEQQGKASGWMGFWTLIGQVCGLVLSGLLLARGFTNRLTGGSLPPEAERSMGIVLLCTICVTALVICMIINLRIVKEVPLAAADAVKGRNAIRDALTLELHLYPDFARLLYSRFIINMGIYSGIEFLRYYVQEALDLPPTADVAIETMYLALAATVGGVAGTFAAGYIADRASKRSVIYVSCGFAALAAILFCLTSSPVAARWIALLFGIGYGSFCAVDWAFATNLMPVGREGKYMAIFHVAFTVPQVLVLIIGGLIGDAYGYRTVFWTIPFYLAIGTVMISKVRERHELLAAAQSGTPA